MERPCHEALTGRAHCCRKDMSFPKLRPGFLILELPACEGRGVCWGNLIYTKNQTQAFPGEGSWPTELEEFLPSSMSTTSLLPGILATWMLCKRVDFIPLQTKEHSGSRALDGPQRLPCPEFMLPFPPRQCPPRPRDLVKSSTHMLRAAALPPG